MNNDIFNKEEKFHDDWAKNENIDDIDVIKMNESVTAPEMRYITKNILSHGGSTLLDVGSGLGEASVYFASKGFQVTALDISKEMLTCTEKLASKNNVELNTVHSTAENLNIDKDKKFDIIYVGNLFHHVNIDETLSKLTRHLNGDGILVSWDPLAYNPAINIYRNIATDVRTKDEHPLTLDDFKTFDKHFSLVKKKYFWFSTLIIFFVMYFLQRRDPNKERYWKKVVDEGHKWSWLYLPLEYFDKIILFLFPFIRPLCWNVVLLCKNNYLK
ncbi:MAG: class I SAM-dependent methyltransferase [Candidatus Cloacimonetes bacterium]|nr:class I SAM-dependent methyltransferase [Candidatus Cloacimonadota bacterium]